nr:hypothetical protein 13 [Balneolaceae bacterium]
MRLLVLIILFINLITFEINAQATLSVWGELEFQGEVKAVNGILSKTINVIKYSSITLKSADGKFNKTITANSYKRNPNINFKKGQFIFKNVPEGTYYLILRTKMQGNQDLWRGTFKFTKPNPVAGIFGANKKAGYVGRFKVRSNSSISYKPGY